MDNKEQKQNKTECEKTADERRGEESPHVSLEEERERNNIGENSGERNEEAVKEERKRSREKYRLPIVQQ